MPAPIRPLTDFEREVLSALVARGADFDVNQIAAELGLDFPTARAALNRLLEVGRIWRANGSLTRYTAVADKQRRVYHKVGRAGTVEHQRDHRVNRRAGA